MNGDPNTTAAGLVNARSMTTTNHVTPNMVVASVFATTLGAVPFTTCAEIFRVEDGEIESTTLRIVRGCVAATS